MKAPDVRGDQPSNLSNAIDVVEEDRAAIQRLEGRLRELELELEAYRTAETALQERERVSLLIMQNIPNLVSLLKPNGEPDLINRQIRDYTGRTEEELRKWNASDLVHPDDLPQAIDTFRMGMSVGERFTITYRMRRHDGVYRWLEAHHQPLMDESGQLYRWCVSVNDIDDWMRTRDALLTDIEARKRAEDELRRREYNLAAGERLSLTGSYAWEVNTDKITCSAQLLRIYEFDDSREVTAAAMRSRIHPDDRPLLEATMAEIRCGRGNPEHEVRLLMPDGRVKYVRAFAQVIPDQQGQLICIGAVQDVTRRRLAEDALDKLRSDVTHRTRVMSFGTLTASIAHELNQPLTGLMMNANTCVRMLTADPPNANGALETARRIIRDSNRAAEVVARLRALFSGKVARNQLVDLNEVTSEVLSLLASDLQRNGVFVQTRFADDLPTITADRVQLQQVILNLLRNACDAMTHVDDRRRQAVIHTTREGHEHVRLSVRDCGVGFEAENAERLFEAFYTTKQSGMGIGLSLSRSIIESHSGRLWAERHEDGGATFSFSIPISSGESSSVE